MEMHIVHTKQDVNVKEPFTKKPNGLAVLGFFFNNASNNENLAIKPLVEELQSIKQPNTQVSMVNSTFKLSDLISGVAPAAPAGAIQYTYSTYPGSLTTPPCHQVVHWINFLTPINISTSQLEAFQDIDNEDEEPLMDNFRPIQPLNGREVIFYRRN